MKINDDANLVLTNLLITLKNQRKRKYIEIKNNNYNIDMMIKEAFNLNDDLKILLDCYMTLGTLKEILHLDEDLSYCLYSEEQLNDLKDKFVEILEDEHFFEKNIKLKGEII